MAHIEKLEAMAAAQGKLGRGGHMGGKTSGFLGPVGGTLNMGGESVCLVCTLHMDEVRVC